MPILLFFLCYIVIFFIVFLCICRFGQSHEAVEQPASYQLGLSESAKEHLLNSYLKQYHLKYDVLQNVFTSQYDNPNIRTTFSNSKTNASFFQIPFAYNDITWNLQISSGQYGIFYGYHVMLFREDSFPVSKKNSLCRITVRQYRNDYLFAEQTTKQHGISLYVLMDSLINATYQTELCLEFHSDKAREAFIKGLRQTEIPQKQYEVYHNKIYLYFNQRTMFSDSDFEEATDPSEQKNTLSRYHTLTNFLSSEPDKLLYLCQYEPDFLQYMIRSICDITSEEGR